MTTGTLVHEGASRLDPRASAIWRVDRMSGEEILISGPADYVSALVLVADGGRSAGIVTTAPTPAPLCAPQVMTLPEAPARPWVEGGGVRTNATVVICTTGRCELLADAVRAVLAQDHADFDVVVVDNAPATGLTRTALNGIDDQRLTIVDEPEPGLSRARNRGVSAARGEIIAFTDDDARVDSHWLTALIDPILAHRLVGGATGIALPSQLSFAPQRWFESRGGFPKSTSVQLWYTGEPESALAELGSRVEGGPLYPMTTARVGAGVCMAFRRSALDEIGPFDEALGAGTPTRGGEDLDLFARMLAAGYAIIHTPDAVVFHRHRVDLAGLETQIRGNGSGMAALLTKSVITRPANLLSLAGRVPRVLMRIRPGSQRTAGADEDVPASLTRNEVKGFLEGPLLYARAVRAARRRPATPPRGA